MPHDPSMRPAWMIRAGLFLYDHLARREVLPGSRTVDLRRHPAGAPLKPSFTQGLRLFRRLGRRRAPGGARCAIDAARARRAGAHAHAAASTRARDAARWQRRAARRPAAQRDSVQRARTRQRRRPLGGAVPAPSSAHAPGASRCAWSRAATSSCRKLFDHDHAYIFQNPDQRIVFAIPYEGRLHADRHHRRRAPRRHRRRAHRRRARSPTCASRRAAISRTPVRAGGRRLELLGRAPAARRRVAATRRR